MFEIRTDLAVEEKESFPGRGGEVTGVSLREWRKADSAIKLTEVVILDQEGARAMGKAKGTYLTIEARCIAGGNEAYCREVSEELAEQLRRLTGEMRKKHLLPAAGPLHLLVTGLGNPSVTPDALGPETLNHLRVNRNLEEPLCSGKLPDQAVISGIVPGVMAQTGMETAEILKGIVEETGPDLVIAIDALAARSIRRLGTTVQLTDTGIHPGSGVGNHRHGLTRESLGVPVIAIGVPTVVGAAAIVHDTISALIQTLASAMETKEAGDFLESLDPDQQYQLIRELLEPEFGSLYVTPPDIDQTIQKLGVILAEAIHLAFCPQTSQNSPGIHI